MMLLLRSCALLSVILTCIQCDNEDLLHQLKNSNGKKLRVLLVSDVAIGHLAPLLAMGQELALRGHNVTQFLALHETEQVRYRKHVEKHGVNLWNVSSPNLIPDFFDVLGKALADDFFSGLINVYGKYGAVIMHIMGEHINKSLSAGDWDVVVGIDYLSVILSCFNFVHETPFVILGKMPVACHLYPTWPWPGFMYGAHSDDMSFMDRFLSFPYDVLMKTYLTQAALHYEPVVAKLCPKVNLRDVMLALGTNFPTIIPSAIGFDFPRTLTPMMTYVGAIMSSSPDPITGKLEQWFAQKPEKSVVYVSMGSIHDLDEERGRTIIEGVMKTNYSVLWSLKKRNQWILKGLDLDPERVMISEWTPQLSVLGSKVIHSAIFHGGFNGLHEAMWNGVPTIVLPQMDEQLYNAGRIHYNKLGILLETITSTTIAEGLRALDTEEYRSKLAKIQRTFRNAGGARRAAELVEFYEEVGYDHLLPSYAKYGWYAIQYYNADVTAIQIAIFLLVLVCLRKCCRCLCKRFLCKDKKDKKD